MKRVVGGAGMAVVLMVLASCSSTPPQPATAGETDMDANAAMPEGQAREFAGMLAKQIATTNGIDGSALHLRAVRDDMLVLQLDARAFRAASGELDVAAFAAVGRFAASAKAAGPCVIHVLGQQVDANADPGTDLGERRAQALVAVLAQFGIPAARLRAEDRAASIARGSVVIVVRPIVVGRAEQAWMPPAAVTD